MPIRLPHTMTELPYCGARTRLPRISKLMRTAPQAKTKDRSMKFSGRGRGSGDLHLIEIVQQRACVRVAVFRILRQATHDDRVHFASDLRPLVDWLLRHLRDVRG